MYGKNGIFCTKPTLLYFLCPWVKNSLGNPKVLLPFQWNIFHRLSLLKQNVMLPHIAWGKGHIRLLAFLFFSLSFENNKPQTLRKICKNPGFQHDVTWCFHYSNHICKFLPIFLTYWENCLSFHLTLLPPV